MTLSSAGLSCTGSEGAASSLKGFAGSGGTGAVGNSSSADMAQVLIGDCILIGRYAGEEETSEQSTQTKCKETGAMGNGNRKRGGANDAI